MDTRRLFESGRLLDHSRYMPVLSILSKWRHGLLLAPNFRMSLTFIASLSGKRISGCLKVERRCHHTKDILILFIGVWESNRDNTCTVVA